MSVSKRELLSYYIVFFFFNAAASFAHPVSPTLYTSYGLRSYIFGAALASMLIVSFLFSPFWGKLTTHVDARWIILIGSLGYAGGQVLFGLSTTEFQFIAARAVTGVFTGAAWVASLAYLVGVTPDTATRGKNLTIYATIRTVGGSFGFMVGGLLGEISPYVSIIAQVSVLAVCGVLLFLICKGGEPPAESLKDMDRGTFWRDSNPFASFVAGRKFMTVLIAILLVMSVMQNLGFTAFEQTFNYYLRDVYGFSSGYNGILKGIMAVLALVANSTLCIQLMRRTDIKKSIVWMLGIYAVTMISAVLVEDLVMFMAFNVAFFVCNSVSVPILQQLITDRAEGPHRNLVIGFFNATQSLGGVLGALLCSFLYPMGEKLPFFMGFVAITIAAVLAFMHLKGSRREKQRGAAGKDANN